MQELGLAGVSPWCPGTKRWHRQAGDAEGTSPNPPSYQPCDAGRRPAPGLAPEPCWQDTGGRWAEEREGTAPPGLLPVSGTVTPATALHPAAAAGPVVLFLVLLTSSEPTALEPCQSF